MLFCYSSWNRLRQLPTEFVYIERNFKVLLTGGRDEKASIKTTKQIKN